MALQVGVIGLKGHQGVALSGIAQREDCRLAAVCDDDESKLAEAAQGPAADENTLTFTDAQQMLAEVELDVVVEAGTDNLRGQTIIACAERGIHVLAEKPLAFTLEELDQVRAAVDRAGVQLSMLLTMRYEPAYLAIKQAVGDGVLGQVCLATMQKSYRLGQRPAWQRRKATFSGIIPFIGIHALDLIRYTSGCHFVSGAGYQGNVGHPAMGDMEDSACLALQLDNGASAAVRLDYCRPQAAPTHGDDRLRLAGNAGVIEATGCGETVTLITQDQGPRELELPPALDQWDNFIGSLCGDEECLVPAADCFYITEVVLRLRDAVIRGLVAELPSPEA